MGNGKTSGAGFLQMKCVFLALRSTGCGAFPRFSPLSFAIVMRFKQHAQKWKCETEMRHSEPLQMGFCRHSGKFIRSSRNVSGRKLLKIVWKKKFLMFPKNFIHCLLECSLIREPFC